MEDRVEAEIENPSGEFVLFTVGPDRWLTFDVPEYFGLNVFMSEGEEVFRTSFTNGRAAEAIGSVWSFLDLTPLGRQETWEDSPEGYPQDPPYSWWRLHDEYDEPTRANR
ncbi:hypothetical protein BH18ACT11_BH18ACT11_10220 [soil metagenome]